MADDDGLKGRRVDQAGESGERALTKIEQQARPAEAQEIRRAGRAGSVGIGRTGTDHTQPHRRIAVGQGPTDGAAPPWPPCPLPGLPGWAVLPGLPGWVVFSGLPG